MLDLFEASGKSLIIMIDCLTSAEFVSLYSCPKGNHFHFQIHKKRKTNVTRLKCFFSDVGLTEFEILHDHLIWNVFRKNKKQANFWANQLEPSCGEPCLHSRWSRALAPPSGKLRKMVTPKLDSSQIKRLFRDTRVCFSMTMKATWTNK